MQHSLARALLGGVIGTAIMTAMMYFVAPMMVGQKMDIAAMLGSMLGDSWAFGMAAHWMNGVIVFPLIYVAALHKRLPGPAAVRGMAWGALLWLVAQVAVMPMMGAGVFSASAGGMKAVSASLMAHLVYGACLGLIVGNKSAQGARS